MHRYYSNKGIAISNKCIAISNKGIAISNKGIAISSKGIAISSKKLVATRAPPNMGGRVVPHRFVPDETLWLSKSRAL